MRTVISVGALCVGVVALVLVIAAGSAPAPSSGEEVEKVAARLTSLQQTVKEQTDALAARIDELEETVTELKKSIAQLKRERPKTASQSLQNQGTSQAADKTEPASGVTAASILKNLDEETKKQLLEELNKLQAEQRLQRTEQFIKQLRKDALNDVSKYGQENGWDVTKEEQVKRILDEAFKKMQKLFKEMAAGRRPQRGFFGTMRQIGEETRSKLLEVMTEEELQDLARRIRGPLGRAIGGRFGPPMRRQPQKPPPAPPNR